MKTSAHETSSMLKALAVVFLAVLLPLQVKATVRGMEKTTKANVSVGSAGSQVPTGQASHSSLAM